MATMTFQVKFVWSGKTPNLFNRKKYEREFTRVHNWLKGRTANQQYSVEQLQELINAYELVYNYLMMKYSINELGELVASLPDKETYLTFELGQTI